MTGGILWRIERTILILKLTTGVFIRSIRTVLFSITEQSSFDTVTITTGKETVLTKRLISEQQRLYFPFLVLQLAVFDGVLPITSLLVDVEVQPCGTPDGLQSLKTHSVKERKGQAKFRLTDDVHWITSRQLSPSPATNLNHSPASLSLQSSASKLSSFFVVVSSCLLTLVKACAAIKRSLLHESRRLRSFIEYNGCFLI